MKGTCTSGSECKFAHSLGLEVPTQPASTIWQGAGVPTASTVSTCVLTSEGDTECNICYEKVLEHSKRFGLLCTRLRSLLAHCDHPFCLDCIRKWRGGLMKNVSKEFFRLCPICRTESYFVIPSGMANATLGS